MNTTHPKPPKPLWWAKPIATLALIFGVMTVISGGNILFGPAEARELAGNYFGFVVWFNFLAGGAYVVAAVGLWCHKNWAFHLAAFIAIATAVVALVFALLVLRGQAFEMRTVGALAFRFTFWAVVAFLARQIAKRV